MHAIRCFPDGSAGAPTEYAPTLDLINWKEIGLILLASLAALINIPLVDNCAKSITPPMFIFLGGTMMALRMKSGISAPSQLKTDGIVWRPDGLLFIAELEHGRSQVGLAGDKTESSYFLERIVIIIQRLNTIAFQSTYAPPGS